MQDFHSRWENLSGEQVVVDGRCISTMVNHQRFLYRDVITPMLHIGGCYLTSAHLGLNILDLYLWDHLKCFMHQMLVAIEGDLTAQCGSGSGDVKVPDCGWPCQECEPRTTKRPVV
ncbi:hypothetical protein TNCV_1966131 [Trichonephila clavipes]|nr:hypothetical protein TNCV_1966131 [Trichonephila clavipes]